MRETGPDMSQDAEWQVDEKNDKKPDSPHSETDAEDKESKEAGVRSYEYRDSEGRVIGRATIETGQLAELGLVRGGEDIDVDARELKSFIWEGEKDGETVKMDLLEMIQHKGDDAFLLENDKDTINSAVYPGAEEGSRTIVAPRPDNLASMAVFLHEFGHADQRFDEEMEDMSGLYAQKFTLHNKSADELVKILDQVAQSLPNYQEKINEAKEVAARIANLEKRLDGFRSEALLLKAKIEGSPTADTAFADAERLAHLNDQIKGVSKAKAYLMEEADPYDVAAIPAKILEMDASMRAIEWFKAIKEQTGSDVFAKIEDSEASASLRSKKSDGTDCAESATDARDSGRATTSVKKIVSDALDSYDVSNIMPEDLRQEYFADDETNR